MIIVNYYTKIQSMTWVDNKKSFWLRTLQINSDCYKKFKDKSSNNNMTKI